MGPFLHRLLLGGTTSLLIAAPLIAQDVTPPRVSGTSVAPGATVYSPPSTLQVTFDEPVDSASVNSGTLILVRSGGDGTFGDGNEVTVVPSSVTLSSPQMAVLGLAGAFLPADLYRLKVAGYGAGSALSFDGVDDFASTAQWLTGTGNTVTMECWAKPLGSGASDGCLTIHRADFNDSYLAWAVATNTFEFSISLNEKATSVGQTYSFGTWYHVAGTYDGTTVRLYVDGTLIGTHAVSKSVNWDTSYLGSFIGGNGAGNPNQFQGEMDEIRIWNVVRTPSQIQQFMNRQVTGDEPGLRACYRLDAGSGQVVLDATPATRHGTLGATASAETSDPAWTSSAAPISGLRDSAGNALDGEFSGTFPSGNAAAGGDFIMTFSLIYLPSSDDSRCGMTGVEGVLLMALAVFLKRSIGRRR